MKRRTFVGGCCAGLAYSALRGRALAGGTDSIKSYDRVRLVGAGGEFLKASELTIGIEYLFHYPYAGSPCFLLRLPEKTQPGQLQGQDGRAYLWSGGVGPAGSIVAFAAICPHQLTRVAKRNSFINYYHEQKSPAAGRSGVISCCAHHSIFDPAQGARPVDGPAGQPLTAIALEYDGADDTLYAVGTQGPEVYEDYFSAYRRELIEEFGRGVAQRHVSGTAPVYELSEYTNVQIRC